MTSALWVGLGYIIEGKVIQTLYQLITSQWEKGVLAAEWKEANYKYRVLMRRNVASGHWSPPVYNYAPYILLPYPHSLTSSQDTSPSQGFYSHFFNSVDAPSITETLWHWRRITSMCTSFLKALTRLMEVRNSFSKYWNKLYETPFPLIMITILLIWYCTVVTIYPANGIETPNVLWNNPKWNWR